MGSSSTIIITGGQGFVGRHLQAELARELPARRVVIWDLPAVDITRPDTYHGELADLQPAWVIHLAALPAVGTSFSQADRYHAINADGTHRLLETIAAASPVTRILAISSSDIYGGTDIARRGQPLPELPLADCRPQNPYAQSKYDMEKVIEERFNDRVIRVRPFAHIGPGQKAGFVTADFASQVAAIEAGQQPPTIQVGNLEAARDFTDVRDVVRAYCLLLEHGHTGEVYNIASGRAVTIQTLLDQLLDAARVDITVEQDPDRLRPADIPVLVGDATKLKETTNWQPHIPLEQSLADILQWWRKKSPKPH